MENRENEHVSMLIGKALNINTPPLGLLKFNDGELTYVIRRFDWNQDKKILKEDMAQIFQLERNDEGTYKYEKSYEEVALKIREATGGKLTQVLDFFERVVYNYLIQNGDYHLKNISLQSVKPDRSGFYEGLTPNYDSVMIRLYSKDERDLALSLLKDDEEPKEFKTVGFYTRPDFEELGVRIGLNTTVTTFIFDRIKKVKPEIDELIEASFLNEENKNKYAENLNSRYKKLGL